MSMESPSFFAELKRRNVYKVAVAYAVVAWLLIQIATQVFPFFEIPNWAVRLVVLVLILGFPVALILAWAFEITPEGIKRAEDVTPGESIARKTGRKLVGITVALAIAAAGLLAFQIFRPGLMRESAATSASIPAPVARTIPEKSIAVLPLVNSSGDPANEYFADGMSEEFISTFSRLPDLKVIGRSSSFQFKGKNESSKTVGEKLGVFYLLEGSVRKSADRVRIAVALVKAGDGTNVWSDTYDRELKDIFAVQSEIAGAVAKELKVALLGKDGQAAPLTATATPSSQNVDAYNAQLQGTFYANRNTAEDFRKAISYFEEAIRLDPRYALAYVGLSKAANNLATNFAPADREALTAKARSSADKAVELDPNLGPAHSAKANILMNIDFDFTAAEAEYRRAVELAPQDPAALANFANLLARLGRLDEAVALTQRAVALDPLRGASIGNLAGYLVALGRYDEAEAAARKAIELQPKAPVSYCRLVFINILRGKPGAAVEFANQVPDLVWRTYPLA
ncbi:MAG: tetratricopeptide repeat protein, partial [Verrucomicrobiota bacterium]|nr:tetratricopeptide repeat protein [Verrucomicrobiota bacterium]